MRATRSQGGFTLIELVIVIVILGILSAVAIPQFIDLSDEAEEAALDGVAGSMSSAMAINYAGCAANDQSTGDDCTTVSTCADVADIMAGGIPGGYSVPPSGSTATQLDTNGNGTTADCSVEQDSTGNTATFQGIGAGQ